MRPSRRRSFLRTVAATGTVTLAGCADILGGRDGDDGTPGENGSAGETAAWREWAGGARKRWARPGETAVTGSVSTEWGIAGERVGAPLVVDGTVYVRYGSAVRALDAATGDEQWTHETAGEPGVPSVADGAVYVGTETGSLTRLDAATGDEGWSVTVPAEIRYLTVAGGQVYVADESLQALDAASGESLWTTELSVTTRVPAVADGTVYVGTDVVRALDAATGDQLWEADAAGTQNSGIFTPSVLDGRVYVSGEAGTVFAFDAASGDRLWETGLGDGPVSPPATGRDALYARSNSGDLVELAPATGEETARFDIGDNLAAPIQFGSVVYVLGERLVGVDVETGETVLEIDAGAETSISLPVVSDGRLYVVEFGPDFQTLRAYA